MRSEIRNTLGSLAVFFVLMLLPFQVLARFTYEGYLTNPDGTPVVSGNVNISLRVQNPAANCVIYDELHTVATSADGYFSVQVGGGSVTFTGSGFNNIFNNSFGALSGNAPCSSYTPTSFDSRNLSVSVQVDGGTWDVLGNLALRHVPMAMQSENSSAIDGRPLANLVRASSGVSAPELSSPQVTELSALIGGTSTQYLQTGAALPAVSGAAVTNISAANISSGQVAAARGGTGVDSSAAANGQLLIGNGSGFSLASLSAGSNITITPAAGGITIASTAGGGSVTSVGLTAPAEFTVGGSPVTASGNLSLTYASQAANLVFAGPAGASGTPTFRALVANDIPGLPWSKISSGTPTTLAGYGITDAMGGSLTSGNVWVGDGGNLAVARLLNKADIRSTVAGPWFNISGSCAAGEGWSYVSGTDNVVCAPFALTTAQVTTALGFTPGSGSLPNGQIFVGNAGNVATGVSLSGDATITNAGALTIASGAVGSSKIADGTIADVDISGSAAIGATKIAAGLIDNTEFGYLNGVTSDIQTQLNGKLSNGGTFQMTAGSAGSPGLVVAGDTNTGLYSPAADRLAAAVGGVNVLTITETGNVGIGSTSPTARLDVVGGPIKASQTGVSPGQAGQVQFGELGANGTNVAAIRAPDSIAANYVLTLPPALGAAGQLLSTDAGGNLSWIFAPGLWADDGTDVYFAGAGQVGIGTASPVDILDIQTNINAPGVISVTNAANGVSAHAGIHIKNDQVPSNSSIRLYSSVHSTLPNTFEIKSPAVGGMNIWAAESNADIRFMTGGSPNERMTIDGATGWVGVGTTTPSERLDVGGAIRIGGSSSSNDGVIRWTGTDFEGRKGGAWVSLTVPPTGLVGSAIYAGVAGCTWGSAANALQDVPADTDCNAPTVIGAASAPGTRIPGVVINNLPIGTYKVEARGNFYNNGGPATCRWKLTDGTTSTGLAANGSGQASSPGLDGVFVNGSVQNVTFRVQVWASSVGADTCQILTTEPGIVEFEIRVIRL